MKISDIKKGKKTEVVILLYVGFFVVSNLTGLSFLSDTAWAPYIESSPNSQAPQGAAWVENDSLRWADGSTEYWIKTKEQAEDKIAEGGAVSGLSDNSETSASFSSSFSETPYVFATTQTTNGGQDPSAAHIRSVSSSGFTTQHCEYDSAGTCDGHSSETNGWVAISPSNIRKLDGMDAGTVSVGDANTKTVNYNKNFDNTPLVFVHVQTESGSDNPRTARPGNIGTSSFDVKFCEQESTDSCDNHASETIAWWAIDPNVADKGNAFDWGTVSQSDSTWNTVSFSQSYSSTPVLIGSMQTLNGEEFPYVEANNVGTSGGDIRFCESNGGDGCDTHSTRTLAWLSVSQNEINRKLGPLSEPGIAYYRMDEGTGQTISDAAGSNDGTLGGSTSSESADPTWVSGRFDDGLSFDGSDDYVQVPNFNEPTGAMTVTAWIRPDTISGDNRQWLVDDSTGSMRSYIRESDSTISWNIAGQEIFSNTALSTNQWYHVAFTFDNSGDSQEIYINGNLDKSASNTGGINSGSDDLYIGYDGYDNYDWYSGKIDEVRVFGKALSQSDIDDIYRGSGSKTGGPPGSWWIENSFMRWIDENGYERSYAGIDSGNNPSGASAGNTWMENSNLFYIDSSGNERSTGSQPFFVDDFEDDSDGTLPDGWNRDDDGSTGTVEADTGRAFSGSVSVLSDQPNTGSPSHWHLWNPNYEPGSGHTLEFEYYISGKQNSGSANSFNIRNTDAGGNNFNLRAYSVNLVGSGGSNIQAFDGDGSGGGSWTDLESKITGSWVSVKIEVDYSNNEYYVEIDGTRYGPFGFRDNGSPGDFPVLDHYNDNYKGWIDNFRAG